MLFEPVVCLRSQYCGLDGKDSEIILGVALTGRKARLWNGDKWQRAPHSSWTSRPMMPTRRAMSRRQSAADGKKSNPMGEIQCRAAAEASIIKAKMGSSSFDSIGSGSRTFDLTEFLI